MKLFAVRDETATKAKDLAYLLYYERSKRFYMELPDNADPWETPLILDSFVRRGERSINAYWSRLWVQQRIIPPDRQNLGEILKSSGLDSYDEYALLTLAEGRCAQDDYYLVPISGLPGNLTRRYRYKVEGAVPLAGCRLLVFFRDGSVKKVDIAPMVGDDRRFAPVLADELIFQSLSVQAGGYGVAWGEDVEIADHDLFRHGRKVSLDADDFRRFISTQVVSSTEAAEILECSRQNIDDLAQRDKLRPVKVTGTSKLFLKGEVLQRAW
ncbi:MAG: DUF2442 domain-containing protein [Fretibacterium sp.]|nr:DUF2442 domain-containing protein [Fretibacterium sp.]